MSDDDGAETAPGGTSRHAWWVYDGTRPFSSGQVDRWLERPPKWRRTRTDQVIRRPLVEEDPNWAERGRSYVPSGNLEVDRANLALLLRRPLLVTGRPGVGKSTLAYNLAWSLDFGPPLRWEINSQTTLRDGLYHYDAVGHLRASQAREQDAEHVGRFITLGPLGTAMLPTERPRVLLIDEMDKASFDLPNDLLNILEEGRFKIPELIRMGGAHEVVPFDPAGPTDRVTVVEGRVATRHHPVVIITSNGERDFPEAFRRRCVPLDLGVPDRETLRRVVRAQLGDVVPDALVEAALDVYRDKPTDQILQDIFLQDTFRTPADVVRQAIERDG